MSSFNDATCPKCGKRFGWQGNMVDKPQCPKCGHTDDPAELAEADAEMERIKKELFGDDNDDAYAAAAP